MNTNEVNTSTKLPLKHQNFSVQTAFKNHSWGRNPREMKAT